MLEHKEELDFVISMFRVAITAYGSVLNPEQQKYRITRVTRVGCSMGLRETLSEQREWVWVYVWVCAHPAPLLAVPHYTDINVSGFNCLQKEKLALTGAWQMADRRLWLRNQPSSFGDSEGKFFTIPVRYRWKGCRAELLILVQVWDLVFMPVHKIFRIWSCMSSVQL